MQRKKQDRQRAEDGDEKIEFVKLVEPLLSTMKSDNQELAALAASALVNLCNYSDDIKEIFFQKNGLNVILEYLTCKREIILLNVLRLILVFIVNSETFTKKITEENDQEAVKSLLDILSGPGFRNTEFSIKVSYFVLIILRQMIKYSHNAKNTILQYQHKDDSKRAKAGLEPIIAFVEPAKLHATSENLEICIYQFLTQLVREEPENKRMVGKLVFERVLQGRISRILQGIDGELGEGATAASSLPLDGECEEHFFGLMSILTRNSEENSRTVSAMRPDLYRY